VGDGDDLRVGGGGGFGAAGEGDLRVGSGEG